MYRQKQKRRLNANRKSLKVLMSEAELNPRTHCLKKRDGVDVRLNGNY